MPAPLSARRARNFSKSDVRAPRDHGDSGCSSVLDPAAKEALREPVNPSKDDKWSGARRVHRDLYSSKRRLRTPDNRRRKERSFLLARIAAEVRCANPHSSS